MADRPDPFRGVKEPTYDVNKFYTRATNDFDHSVQVRISMPMAMKAEIAKWVRMGVIPEYRTEQDVIRDAIHHRMQFLADRVGDWEASEVLAIQAGLSQVSQTQAALREKAEFFAGLDKLMAEFERNHAYISMAEFLDRLELEDFQFNDTDAARFTDLVEKWRAASERGTRRREAEA